jgi:hypothetical protein
MVSQGVDLKELMRRHPYGTVAGALGIGFILGGGLFTRLTARIIGTGLRIGLMAALPLVKDEVIRVTLRGFGDDGRQS